MVGDVAFGVEIEGDLLLVEHFLLDDGLEQPVLVGEIDVQRPLGYAGGAGDLAHAGAVETQIHEDLAGAGENLPALGAVFVADDVERSAMCCNH